MVATLLLVLVLQYLSDVQIVVPMATAYVIHLVIVFLLLPHLGFLYPDVGTFHSMTLSLLAGEFPTFATGVDSFIAFQSILYLVFSEDYRVVTIFNSLFSVLLVLPIIVIARDLYPDIRTRRGLFSVLILFLPIPFLQLTLPLRDSLSLLLFFSLLACVSLSVSRDRWWSLLCFPLGGLTYLLRSELVLLLFVALLAGTGFSAVREWELNQSFLGIVVGGSGVIGFLAFTRRYSINNLNTIVQARASGRAAYLASFEYTSWMDVIVSAPIRAVYFLFAPFPSQMSSVFDLAPAVMSLVLIAFVVTAYRSLSEANPNYLLVSILGVLFLGGITGYGLIDSNYGTTIRHRIPFVYLLVVFSAPVIYRYEDSIMCWLRSIPNNNSSENSQ